MRKNLIIQLFICLVLVIIGLAACKEPSPKNNNDISNTLIFQRFGLTKLGKDYPTPEALKEWKKQNQLTKTYHHVQDAKKELAKKITIDPIKVLVNTLDTICMKCDRSDNEMQSIDEELECVGAITALYFFDSDEDDKIIMERLMNASPKVHGWVAAFRYEWFYNRPKPVQWIESIQKLDENQYNREIKISLINLIKAAIDIPEKFGVML